ncbi:MAG: IS607 family transposase, partial [Hydrogenophaga sp.]|uniref:IS607 family transposase n=1 Tax=Hydrogenophaga sp. TaxID=1904254 RepID=UPI00262A03E9
SCPGIIYARVSSPKQRADLQRQVVALQEAYPQHQLIQDVGSGLNFKRKGLRALLERVNTGMVPQVVVMHRDRLARFATDLLEFVFQQHGTKLVLHCPREAAGHGDDGDDATGYNELAEDLLAVTTVFVASHNGKRSAAHRRLRHAAASQEDQGRTGAGAAAATAGRDRQ